MHLWRLRYTDENLTDQKAAVIYFVMYLPMLSVDENIPSSDRTTHPSALTLLDGEVLVGI